jgi:hypothetical protein
MTTKLTLLAAAIAVTLATSTQPSGGRSGLTAGLLLRCGDQATVMLGVLLVAFGCY